MLRAKRGSAETRGPCDTQASLDAPPATGELAIPIVRLAVERIDGIRSGAILPVGRAAACVGNGDDVDVADPNPVGHEVGEATDSELARAGLTSTRRANLGVALD